MRGKFFMTFLAAIMAAHATPRLAPPSVNLGRFDADAPPEAVFTLSNPDGEPCPVSRVRTGCPCVTASADRDEIPPGGSAAVTVAPKAGALSGPFTHTVFIEAGGRLLRAFVSGEAVPPFRISPSGEAALGVLRPGQRIRRVFEIRAEGADAVGAPLAENCAAKLTPTGKGLWRLELEAKAPREEGPFSCHAALPVPSRPGRAPLAVVMRGHVAEGVRTPADLDEAVAIITSPAGADMNKARIDAIHGLPSNLSERHVAAFHAFLRSPLGGQPLGDLDFNALKNELVFALMRQKLGGGRLAELLAEMSLDGAVDMTWRDYCVQFLGKYYPSAPHGKGREAMGDALWRTLADGRGSRLAGSAALQLADLAEAGLPGFPRLRVAAACLAALKDPACHRESQLTLVQTLSRLRASEALPEFRRLADAVDRPLVRMAAVAAIGDNGTSADRALLQELANGADARTGKAAKAALKRMDARLAAAAREP